MIKVLPSPLTVIALMTNPAELARVQAHRRLFDLSWAWLKDHATERSVQHRGKYVVVAAEQALVSDTVRDV